MNELKPEDVMKAVEELRKHGLNNGVALGYHAGWCDEVADLLENALALLREKDARIKELEDAQGAEFTCFVGEPHKVDRCPYGDELARLQKEVAEKDAEIGRLENEVARLTYICRSYALQYGTVMDQHEVIERVKAEAREEFAEKVREEVIIRGEGIYLIDLVERKLREVSSCTKN